MSLFLLMTIRVAQSRPEPHETPEITLVARNGPLERSDCDCLLRTEVHSRLPSFAGRVEALHNYRSARSEELRQARERIGLLLTVGVRRHARCREKSPALAPHRFPRTCGQR